MSAGKSPITTHVLDTAAGKPAAGVPVLLEKESGGKWDEIGRGATNADGRCPDLLPPGSAVQKGTYRISFDLKAYYQNRPAFYPSASITFEIQDPSQHYHVPLLTSGHGYSTYRGS